MKDRRFRKAAVAGLLAAAIASCGETEVRKVPPPEATTNTFEQAKASAIDILFVVDDSASMAANQQALSSNFEHFFRLIDPDPTKTGEPGEVDYRLAVTTTDVLKKGGELVGDSGEPKIIRRDDGFDAMTLFKRRVMVGTKGASREEGFRAAELAIETAAQIEDSAGKKAFLRPEAYLYIIFVSDEDDESRDEVRYHVRRFRALKGMGNEGSVLVSAIAGPVNLPEECKTDDGKGYRAARGHRYLEMVEATGGTFGNICLSDWAETLEELAFTGLGLRKRFQLKEPARYKEDADGRPRLDILFESVKVYYPCSIQPDDPKLAANVCHEVSFDCKGENPRVTCTPMYDFDHVEGFWFDQRENALVFGGAAVPGPGSVVEVVYFARGT